MGASIAVAILALAAAVVFICGIALAAQQALFIAKSYRVPGRVSDEWTYRGITGNQMRYYRVDFCLSNGQPANLRSGGTSSSKRPKVGQTVPVLVREGAGNVKAKIGTIGELWFGVFVLLFVGGGSSLLLLPWVVRKILAA